MTDCVRLRPLLSNEKKKKNAISCVMKYSKIYLSKRSRNLYGKLKHKTERFDQFDYLYNGKSQYSIYQDIGAKVVDYSINNAINICVFSYGQTNSGKTYTMLGEFDDKRHFIFDMLFEHYKALFHIFPVEIISYIHSYQESDLSKRGLIPRICKEMFEKLEKSKRGLYEVFVQFVEIYNEKTRDLLVKGSKFCRNSVSECGGDVKIAGVGRHPVTDYKNVLKLLGNGLKRRITKSTKGNKVSSRSHAIFTLYIRTYNERNRRIFKAQKINLCDLAGSEKYSKKNYKKERKKEGCFINQSLLELGRCLGIAVENSKTKNKIKFVPVRSSLLTHVLKDSLGGKSKVFMINNISPCKKDIDETYSTLVYAKRAKEIKLKLKKNKEEDWGIKLKVIINAICNFSKFKRESERKFKKMRKKEIDYTMTTLYREYLKTEGLIKMYKARMNVFLERKIEKFDYEIVNEALIDVLLSVISQLDNTFDFLTVLSSLDSYFGVNYWALEEVNDWI